MHKNDLLQSIQDEIVFLTNLWHQLHQGRAAITSDPVVVHAYRTRELIADVFKPQHKPTLAAFVTCEHRMTTRAYALRLTTCPKTGETFIVAEMPRSWQEFYETTAAHLAAAPKPKKWWQKLWWHQRGLRATWLTHTTAKELT